MPKEIQERLQKEITNLIPGLPSGAFQFDSNRAQAESYLNRFPEVPFIIRESITWKDHFTLTTLESNGKFAHILIELDKTTNKFLTFRSLVDGVKFEDQTLSSYVNDFWRLHQNKNKPVNKAEVISIPSADKEKIALKADKPVMLTIEKPVLQKAADGHAGFPVAKAVVMSIQSLDAEKIALSADKLEAFAKAKPGLAKPGDGHTGFAMAKALGAPFVVLRTKGNREETNKILKDHLVDNGLLILTGHGSQDGTKIRGNYINRAEQQLAKEATKKLLAQQIDRGPADIVSSAMDGGLKCGNHITILLSICFGAADTKNTGNSFAHKLAREFAKEGISTTIIASDKPVWRFGYEVIKGDKLTFNSKTGIDPKTTFVFTTKVESPNADPQIEVSKTTHAIQLSKAGMEFIDPQNPVVQVIPSAPVQVPVTPVPLKVNTPPLQTVAVAPLTEKVGKENIPPKIPALQSDADKPVPLKAANVLKNAPLKESVTQPTAQQSPLKPTHAPKISDPKQPTPDKSASMKDKSESMRKEDFQKATLQLVQAYEKKQRDLLRSFKKEPELANLFASIQNMKQYGESLSERGVSKGFQVKKLANQLDQQLEKFLLDSVKKPPKPAEVTKFKADFKKLLHSKDDEMHRHREIWKPIVGNILLALSGVMLLIIIAKVVSHLVDAAINKKQPSFNQAFFNAKTKTQELGDEVDQSINEITSILPPK